MPDEYTEIINELPADLGLRPRIAPWAGSVEQGATAVEALLDKHELRRVVLLGCGVGATVALRIAAAQPGRVSHLVLAFPAPLRRRLMFRKSDHQSVSTPTLTITGSDAPAAAEHATIPGATRRTFTTHPREVAELLSVFLR